MSPKILIVGAGPTGLSCACFLLKAGFTCDIIDKLDNMQSATRAVGVNHAGLHVLDQLDILNLVVQEGCVVDEILVYWKKKRIVSLKSHRLHAPYQFFLYCPQPIIEKYLTVRLHQLGGVVRRKVELESFTNSKNMVTVELRNRGQLKTENYDMVIGCDGGHSAIRKELSLDSEFEDYGAGFLVVDVKLESALLKTEYFIDESGYIMLVPLPKNGCRVIFSFQGPCQADFHWNMKVAKFIQEQCRNRIGKILPILKITWMASGPIRHRISSRVVVDSIVLMGDAAHLFSPIGGTNMNMGLQDAMVFFDKIYPQKDKKINASLLLSYEKDRKIAFEINLQKTKLLSHLMLRSEFRENQLEEKFLPKYKNREFIRHMIPEFLSGNIPENGEEKFL